MLQNSPLLNVTSASDAIIGMMGMFYMSYLPYPQQYNGTFLFIRSEVLGDEISEEKMPLLTRLRAVLDMEN